MQKVDKVGTDSQELDQEAMIDKLRKNMTIVEFCTGDLKENHQFSGNTALLMSNFSFLLKSSLMQVIFVSLGAVPIPCLGLLILTEGVYFLQNIVYYAKNRHLKSFFLMLPKIV